MKCYNVGLIVLYGFLTCVTTNALGQEENSKEERMDRPGQAAEFRALMTNGGVETPVAPDAVQKAATKINALRRAVAERYSTTPRAMAVMASQGPGATIGGIPVGPLPAKEVALNGDMQVVPVAMALDNVTSINPSGWKWHGPGNIGGRIRSVVIHPTNTSTIWIGAVGGGVWKTNDGGVSWAPLTDMMANIAISCMVIDPDNPDRLYVGTGEGFYNADSIRGFGVFVTNDGGATWNQMASTANDKFRFVNRIAISPAGSSPKVILVATRNGMYRSTDEGSTFSIVSDQEILDTRFHPTEGKKCIAGLRSGKTLFSTDAGTSWTSSTGITPVTTSFGGRVELTYAKANPDVVFASVDDGVGKLYRSTDGGKTFLLRSSPGHLAGQGWYANCLWAGDTSDPNLVVVGGLDLHRSTNGGTSFSKISRWQSSPQSAHADHHAIISHPKYDGTTNKTVYFANDGGLYRATDVKSVAQTSGWQELNNGLGVTQFYGAGVHTPTGSIIGGAQDNGTLFLANGTGSESWREVFGGDGGDSAAAPVDMYLYGEYVYLQIHRGKDGGQSEYIFNGLGDAGSSASALFIAPFILDPNDPKRLLAGGARLWRTTDATVTMPNWKAIKPSGSGLISAITVAAGASDHMWVGTSKGQIEKSNNATQMTPTWTSVPFPSSRYCSRLVLDAHDTNYKTAYVTTTGYASGNLNRTVDGGTTWTTLGGGALPEIPFYDLVLHPSSDDVLYLATELGVFVSDDAGVNWSPTNQGPTNAPVYRLLLVNGNLYAITHGRGIFSINIEAPVSQAAPPPIPAPMEISP